MASSQSRSAASVARALAARLAACCLVAVALAAHADELDDAFDAAPTDPPSGLEIVDESTTAAPQVVDEPADAGPLALELAPPAQQLPVLQDPAQLVAPDAEQLDAYHSMTDVQHEGLLVGDQPPAEDLRPFDWMRHWGFHHSSTEGPFLDRGLPMERTSWLNRPYHFDWFLGPLLSDGPVDGRVSQSNELFGGIRLGWDFDYYWGVEWRFGWSDPVLIADSIERELQGDYLVSDIDFVYYPWGDTKVRPYVQWGLGLTQIGSVREDGTGQEATLLSMPLGIGVRFPQTHWLAWRLEIIDNLAFGADGVDTLNNFAFTAGMELRMGARPNSYWPWRSSRTIW